MIDGELEFEVDRILNHRTRKRGRKQVTEYLIRWKGYDAEHDFWQDDTENMPDIVKAYWDRKDPAERLHVSCLRINRALPTNGAGTQCCCYGLSKIPACALN